MSRRKITVITTKNCIGCQIQVEHVQTAIAKTFKEIELEVKDFNDVPKRLLHENKINDYPATLFINKDGNDIVKFKYIGSIPIAMIQRYIDVYLK